jgi:hypothetical protein
MTRETLHFTVVLSLLSLVFVGVLEAQQVGTAKTQSGSFQVKFSKGHLSVEANQAPLVKIFEEIGKQARIVVDSSIGPEEKITIQLDHVALEDAIKQLAKNVTIFYAEDSKAKTLRIARLVVLPEGNQQAPQFERAKELSKPVKANEPAPKPEPFRFEFDPSKSVGKEKPR